MNNFFAHWIKEIDIKRLGDDIHILPTTNTIDIYKYFNAMLKHLPKKALKVIENDLLYSKKKVKLPDDEDRQDERTAAGEDADIRTDNNINERIQKLIKKPILEYNSLEIYMGSRASKHANEVQHKMALNLSNKHAKTIQK